MLGIRFQSFKNVERKFDIGTIDQCCSGKNNNFPLVFSKTFKGSKIFIKNRAELRRKASCLKSTQVTGSKTVIFIIKSCGL